jgi:uncharacterized protein YjdB
VAQSHGAVAGDRHASRAASESDDVGAAGGFFRFAAKNPRLSDSEHGRKMSRIFAAVRKAGLRFGWIVLVPLLSVCSGENSGPLVADPPGTVSDLAVAATTDISATLSFTEVDDGMGEPAKYDVRYSAGPMSWDGAASVGAGTCAAPIAGDGVGSSLSCTVVGLTPGTAYNFQVAAFRGTLGQNAIWGGASNIAAATTTSPPPPNPVVTTVTVSPPSASVGVGATTALQAAVKDQNGNTMSGQTVTWSTDNAPVATVSSSGVVSGLAAGSANITATSSGKSGSAVITVTAAPPVVTTVTVSPPSASVVAGSTVTLQVAVKDQYGNAMTGQSVTWSTNNSAAATVSTSGVVTGVAAGTATVSATTGGKSGSSTITVTAAPPPPPVVTTVTVAPPSASVVAGNTVSLQAIVKDQNGNTMSGQTVAWSSNNTAAATVNGAGVVTGVAAGSATISATVSGKIGTSSITVTPVVVGGGTLLFQEDFENSNIASRGWYDNTSVQLSTTEHITGSTASAQYHWLKGATTPTSGDSQRHKFTASDRVYLSYYVKYSTNYIGSGQDYHPHEFYILSNLDGDYDGPSDNFLDVYVEQNYQNGGKPIVDVQDNKSVNTSRGAVPNNLVGVTENRSVSGCNGLVESNIYSECYDAGSYWYNYKQLSAPVQFQPNPGPGYKNNWNFVEVYVQLNTISNGIGQADGIIQYWFNGNLVIDRHDILFRTGAHANLLLNQLVIAPYIGDGSPADQTFWVDNLRLGTGRLP